MMLSARIGAWAKSGGGWTNPYVTDGLVAMWDGEWNAGGGAHVDETMEWHDVCGNEPPLVPYDGCTPLVFVDNALITTSVAPFNESSGRLFGGSVESYTIECGFRNLRCGYGRFPFCNGLIGSTNGTGFKAETWSSTYTNVNLEVILSNDVTKMNSTISTNERLTLSLAFDGIGLAYKNGLFDIQAEQHKNKTINKLLLGGVNYETCFSEYYFIRVYSRALAADEIAANYVVDKARFGIGGEA